MRGSAAPKAATNVRLLTGFSRLSALMSSQHLIDFRLAQTSARHPTEPVPTGIENGSYGHEERFPPPRPSGRCQLESGPLLLTISAHRLLGQALGRLWGQQREFCSRWPTKVQARGRL